VGCVKKFLVKWEHLKIINPVINRARRLPVRVSLVKVVRQGPQNRVCNLRQNVVGAAKKKKVWLNLFEAADFVGGIAAIENCNVALASELTRQVMRALSIDNVPTYGRQKDHGAFAGLQTLRHRLQLIEIEGLIGVALRSVQDGSKVPSARRCFG
jgi:hypothetical protein